jgi:hypothetical protein
MTQTPALTRMRLRALALGEDGQARRDEVTRRVNSTGQRIACAIRGQTVRERFVWVGTT